MNKVISRCFTKAWLYAICLAFAVTISSPSDGGNIFDTNVEKRLRLKPHQKKKVRNIIRASDRRMKAVFRKYGIDPNATPKARQLRRAAKELRAIEKQEIQQMSKVLTPEQFEQYRFILAETAARVREAVQ